MSRAVNDPVRLAALQRTGLLDTPPEEAFDRLTRVATAVLRAPVALVSLVDADRQYFKSQVGLPEPWAGRRETPLTHSFCQHAVASREPLVIEDAAKHPLVRDNLAIPDLGVVAYAGIPLITREGDALGSFCVIDSKPRVWTADELAILRDLAASVVTEIELRLMAQAAEDARRRAEMLAAEREAILSQTAEGVIVTDAQGSITFVNEAARRLHGVGDLGVSVADYSERYHLYTLDGRLHPPDDLPLARAVTQGEIVVDARWRIRRPDGTDIVAQGSAAPVFGADGARLASVLVMRDATPSIELERARAEREAAEARLEGVQLAAREMADLLGNALVTPAAAVELLRQHALPPELATLVQRAVVDLRRAAEHLTSLQQVERVETKPTPVGPALDLRRSTA